MSVLTKIWTTAAAASLVAVPALGAGTAVADSGPQPSTQARFTRACGRLPARIERLAKLQARFHADAGTKGSIAFLQARIDRARAAGHGDLARVLSDRLAVRRDIAAQLPDVLAKLQDAQRVCAQHSSTPGPSSSASSPVHS